MPEAAPSEAVPDTVNVEPPINEPAAGLLTVEVGGVLSTVTAVPAPGSDVLPAPSTARALMVHGPSDGVVHEKLHGDVPVAFDQVVPPSVETSTLLMPEPPVSPALPVIVRFDEEMYDPDAGLVMEAEGGEASSVI